METVYTTKKMLEILGVKESTLRKYRDDGFLGYSKLGDKIWYTSKQLEDFLNHPKIKHEAFA